MKTAKEFLINQVINYTNGNPTINTGKIMRINGDYLSVLDHNDKSAVELSQAGYSVTAHIHVSQVC